MRKFFCIFALGISSLNASEVDRAYSSLESSKKEYSQTLEYANLEKEKLLAEYSALSEKLRAVEAEYKSLENSVISVQSLEDELKFLENNFASLEAQSALMTSDIFNLSTGEINEEKLFAFPEKYIPREQMPKEVEAFYSSQASTLPVDLSEGKVFEARAKTFLEKLSLGGLWVYPIGFFAIISLCIILVKLVGFFRIKTLTNTQLEEFSRLMKKGDYNKAKLLYARFSLPYKNMLDELFADSKLSKNLLEEVSYENMLKVGDNLHRGLGFISVTASIAPLLGLLGTVSGIIKTFSDLAVYGNSNPNLLSSGISEALITTEFGLSLAIPAFVLYAYLSRRAKRILSDMEKVASVFISSIKA